MKTKSILGLLLIFTLILTSCKKELSANENVAETSTLTTNSDSIPVSETSTEKADLSNSGEVKLNPAHGQAGHRCDIAVGAPLNSPASPSSLIKPSEIQQLPVSNPVATPTNTNTPRPKLNPAHGQPHHDCKIQVGDPLPGS